MYTGSGVELIVELRHHLPKQEISCLLLWLAVPLHHVGFVRHILFVSGALALHRWVASTTSTRAGAGSENARKPCVDEFDAAEES